GGVLLPHRKEVQPRGREEKGRPRGGGVGQQRGRLPRRRVGEAPHHPEEHRPRRFAGGDREDEEKEGREKGVRDEPREQEALQIEPPAPPRQRRDAEGG